MKNIRAMIVLACGLLAAGGVCSALGWPRAAGALACFGLAAGLLALAVASRAVLRDLDRVTRRVDAVGQAAQRTTGRQQAHNKRVREQLREVVRATKAASSSASTAAKEARTAGADLRRTTGDVTLPQLRTSIEELPHSTAELARLYDSLVSTPRSLPMLGGWAATTPTILALVDEVRRRSADGPINVVECGSGASTVWVAHALAESGHGHVYALEHEPAFAEQTRDFLRSSGLDRYATVIDAPLVETTTGDRSSPWYEIIPGAIPDSVDVLFVDGPPGVTAELARVHAFPVLASRMQPGAWVALDDTHRTPERRIARAWQSVPADGRVLRRTGIRGRSTIFEVVEVTEAD